MDAVTDRRASTWGEQDAELPATSFSLPNFSTSSGTSRTSHSTNKIGQEQSALTPSLGGPTRFKRGAWKLVGSCTAPWNRRGTRHTDSLQTPSAKQTPRSLLKRPRCGQTHDLPHARRRGSTSVLFLSPCRTCTHWVPRDRLSFVEEFTHLKARSHAMRQNNTAIAPVSRPV